MSQIKSFKDLKIWKRGIELVDDIYRVTRNFPQIEDYVLKTQMRRCAISVPSNISEGFGRNSRKEYKQFLHIARGSLFELETQLQIAIRQNYITIEEVDALIEKVNPLSKMIMKLIKML